MMKAKINQKIADNKREEWDYKSILIVFVSLIVALGLALVVYLTFAFLVLSFQ